MKTARDTLFALLIVSAGAYLASVAAEELLVADTMGRLDVEVKDSGLDLADAVYADLPPKAATAFFRKKLVMTPREFGALEDSYKAKGFSVAGLNQRYALRRVHSLLGDAIEQGTTKHTFVKELDAQFARWGLTSLGRHHIETVFDTNVLGAYAAGRHAQMTRPAMLKLRPYWQYRTAGDKSVRPAHRAMNGRVFEASNPVWDTWYPPNGYRCRCGVFSLSKRDVDRRKLKVEDKPPRQVEINGQVSEVIPDMGFASSPSVQARTDKAIGRVRKQIKGSGMLRAPSMTRIAEVKAGKVHPPVHNSAGDLLRIDDVRRAKRVDRFAGLSAKRAEGLAREQPFFNVFPKGQLGKVPKGEVWVEVPIYSQNLDTAEQIVRRLAGDARLGSLAERIKVAGRASYGDYNVGAWLDPEVVWDRAAARRLKLEAGHVFSRNTETVLRVVAKSDAEVKAALRVAMQTEKGHGAAVRRAWFVGDIRIRGAAKSQQNMYRAFLNRRKKGAGEQVVISRGGPIPGWESEPVMVPLRLFDFLPDYSGGKGKGRV